jgi:hypothetical protein
MTRQAKSLNRQRLEAEDRRADVSRMVRAGSQQVEIARQKGVSVKTIQRDIQFLMKQSQEANRSQFDQWRNEHIQELYDLRLEIEALRERPDKPLGLKAIDAMLGVLSLDMKLKGTEAPSRSVHANVSPEHSVEYLKFKKATSGLSEEQLESVYEFALSIERSYTPPVMDATWFPEPETKELCAAELVDAFEYEEGHNDGNVGS